MNMHSTSPRCVLLQLGPDMRATIPLVMNFSVTGGLEVSGPAHPDKVRVALTALVHLAQGCGAATTS